MVAAVPIDQLLRPLDRHPAGALRIVRIAGYGDDVPILALRDDGFIKRVKETIENPGFIYEDFAESDRLVYYRHEYSVNGQPRYVKVSIDIEKIPYFVITAFRPARVKERGKTKLIHGNDEQ